MRHIPLLSEIPISKVQIRKINGDPSFQKPYNIFIRFKTDSVSNSQLMNIFQSYSDKIDTNALKIIYRPKELSTYFSMKSINAIRNPNLENFNSWWDEIRLNDMPNVKILVAPYFDNNTTGRLVFKNSEADGRVAFCIIGEYCYLLIECWG